MKTTIDNAGRIVLPEFVQKKLGVRPGDELVLEDQEGKWVIRSATDAGHQLPNNSGEELSYDQDDMNWPDLEYGTIAPTRLGKTSVRFEKRDTLKPMPHDLDEE